jgi:DNA replication and repair protein RecF
VSLVELRLHNLRCLAAAELALHPRLNLITGPNGAGKTTLLEAVYLLGRGRSFRTRHTEQLIRRETDGMWVAGRLEQGPAETPGATHLGASQEADSRRPPVASSEAVHRVDLQCDRRAGVVARIDTRAVSSLTELSQVLPVQVIDPGIHRLIEEGPARRRRWLDWAVFHVEPGFLAQWQAYMRALRQRNAALRSGPQGDPLPWEPELARLGEALTEARARVLEAVQPYWAQALEALQAVAATLAFQPGWPRELPLARQLDRQRDRDRERRHTGPGPHRCDVGLSLQGRPVREVISRGQQKVLGAAMTLALGCYVAAVTGHSPALLLDDPAAELDAAHTERLLSAVTALGGQCLVTALGRESLGSYAPDRAFHVEHGGIKTL